MSGKYLGKFRGKVVQNVDPQMQGRIVAVVPAVSELPLSWALPCAPYAGAGVGFFALPPIDSNVWIEFENGDPNYPIWVGGFWAKSEVPAVPALPTSKVFKTESMSVLLDDLSRELKIDVKTEHGTFMVTVGPQGVEVSVGDSTTLQVEPDGLRVKSSSSSVKVDASEISLQSGDAIAKVQPASIGLKHGCASVVVTPTKVEIEGDGPI